MATQYYPHINGYPTQDIFNSISKEYQNPFQYLYAWNSFFTQNKESSFSFAYDIATMLEAEFLLFQLDVIETLKYGSNIVSIRPAILYYSDNRFDLEKTLEYIKESLHEDTSINITKHLYGRNRKINPDLISYNNIRRKRPNAFLEYMVEHIVDYYPFDIFPASGLYNEKFDISKNHYTPYIQLPEVLFMYKFFSGRIYNDSYELMQNSTEKSGESYESYKGIFDDFKKYFSFKNEEDIKASPTKIIHRYRLEKLFHFQHIIYLKDLYQFFMSEECLDQLASVRYINNPKISEIRTNINTELFMDKLFVTDLFSTHLVNPAYLIFVLYQRRFGIGKGTNLFTSLNSLLKDFIIKADSHFLRIFKCSPMEQIVLSDKETINIKESEQTLVEKIINNPIAKDFLLRDYSFDSIDASFKEIESFFTYDILVDIITNDFP